jgi:hypothetical protein
MDGLLNLGNVLIILGLAPLAFLIYTLLNLKKLDITISHPRVLVELSMFLVLLFLGIIVKI